MHLHVRLLASAWQDPARAKWLVVLMVVLGLRRVLVVRWLLWWRLQLLLLVRRLRLRLWRLLLWLLLLQLLLFCMACRSCIVDGDLYFAAECCHHQPAALATAALGPAFVPLHRSTAVALSLPHGVSSFVRPFAGEEWR